MLTSGLIYLIVVTGLFGLVIGSFLYVVAYRVPAGVSLMRESRCPHCDAPVRWWQSVPVVSWLALRGRCANCHASISARYPIIEAITGVAFAGVTWFFVAGDGSTRSPTGTGAWSLAAVIVAFLYFAAISIVLTLIDLDTHRLLNAIVLPSYPVAAVLLALACVLGADWWGLLRAGIGMAAMYVFYFVLRLVRPDGMGGGDVKLAGVVGLYLGWVGWAALAVGAFAAFLLGGVYGVVLLASRKASRRTAIPFGPWMLAGAWTGIITGEIVGRFYGGLYGS
ncbi:prepilin peptidase [Microbacterium sp. BWT-B31]|uniref:prepilin peptidase n=1 Tax=Microbacterium sp. BWT-B31 TaxID=3232072 RepID=UPI0035271DBA